MNNMLIFLVSYKYFIILIVWSIETYIAYQSIVLIPMICSLVWHVFSFNFIDILTFFVKSDISEKCNEHDAGIHIPTVKVLPVGFLGLKHKNINYKIHKNS